MISCDDKISQLVKLGNDNPITFLPSYFIRSTNIHKLHIPVKT
jgi:hypothetical protein